MGVVTVVKKPNGGGCRLSLEYDEFDSTLRVCEAWMVFSRFLLPAQGGGVSLRKVRRSLVFGILGILSFAWATSVHAHTLVEDHFDHGIDEEIWRVYRSSETGLIQTIAGKLFIYDVMPSDYTVHQNC